MVNVVEQVAEKVVTRFAVELADWVHEHVQAHPLTRDNRAGVPTGSDAGTAPAAAASSPPA